MVVICCMGIAGMVSGLLDITKGQTTRLGKGPGARVYKRDENPVRFWVRTGGLVVIGGIFSIKGLCGVLSKE